MQELVNIMNFEEIWDILFENKSGDVNQAILSLLYYERKMQEQKIKLN
jgi:hypothetical protein